MAVSKELLDILVCPRCKGKIEPSPEGDGLDCKACKLRFPIRDDIPVMLVGEAESID